MSTLRLRLGLPSLLCAAVAPAAFGQSRPQEATPPVFGAEVSLVAVPVFVTDKSG